jgi:hypothetical protein
MIPGQCKRNRFRPHDLSLVNRFALNHIPARKKIIFTVNKNVPTPVIEGQLNTAERELLMRAIKEAPVKPRVAIEVGTWLGGGSTLHILRALEGNGVGHLWGIEADRAIFDRMNSNIRAGAPEAAARFTPMFGRSQDIIPQWLAKQDRNFKVDFAFLDGGNNPLEQIVEFKLLDPFIPVGGQLMAHDAKWRKGKWFVPYLSRLDNWQLQLHDISEWGLLHAVKRAPAPSAESLKAARSHLFKLRLSPMELVGAILPSRVCGFILKLLPQKLFWKLYSGAKP